MAFTTYLMALITLALAGATAYLGLQTSKVVELERSASEVIRQQAEAARRQADAAQEQAQSALRTLAELQRERELSWRPRLVVAGADGSLDEEVIRNNLPVSPDKFTLNVTVRNVGRGPAVSVLAAYFDRGYWWFSRSPTDIGPRDEMVVSLLPAGGDHVLKASLFVVSGQPAPEGKDVHALFCLDEVGSKVYRFLDGRAGLDVWEAGQDRPHWAAPMLEVAPHLEPAAS